MRTRWVIWILLHRGKLVVTEMLFKNIRENAQAKQSTSNNFPCKRKILGISWTRHINNLTTWITYLRERKKKSSSKMRITRYSHATSETHISPQDYTLKDHNKIYHNCISKCVDLVKKHRKARSAISFCCSDDFKFHIVFHHQYAVVYFQCWTEFDFEDFQNVSLVQEKQSFAIDVLFQQKYEITLLNQLIGAPSTPERNPFPSAQISHFILREKNGATEASPAQ